MAMLATKAPHPTPVAGSPAQSAQLSSGLSGYRAHNTAATSTNNAFFVSPTESDFSDLYEVPESVKSWNEDKVGDWLRGINCGQYADLFRRNNITGEILMEMDQTNLKEMGIKKIGDRVRIGSQAKVFRNREMKKATKRAVNRESMALLDTSLYTPWTSSSPKPPSAGRAAATLRPDRRLSRQINGTDHSHLVHSFTTANAPSRPNSPQVDGDSKTYRSQRMGATSSPMEVQRREQHPSYFAASRQLNAATDAPTSRYTSSQPRSGLLAIETPQSARLVAHARASPSVDISVTNSSILPADKALIRVIYDTARSSVVNIEGCKSADEIMLKTLRKGMLNESHVKNYCFYLLDGIDAYPASCRRLSESDLWRICSDGMRLERGRLILRKIHSGEPEEDQLRTAAGIAVQQLQQSQGIIVPTSNRSQQKVEKIMGESLAAVSYPLSPTSQLERERHINSAAQDLEREQPRISSAVSQRARKLKEFYGARPPSELIASDLGAYFPDVQKEDIEKTVRMSVRRSRRISRATSRLSIVSNTSFASSMRDVPPLPTIADSWLNSSAQARPPRPLSVLRLGGSHQAMPGGGAAGYRDSVTSSVLEPLEEESPTESSRKSYVSLGESATDGLAVTDPEGHTTLQSYFDDTGSSPAGTEGGDSLNKRLSQVLAEDGEEFDPELTEYLESDSWENMKYMKGALIGQGSFGSVYLALHAVTGGLMAVKQVEMPSSSGTQLDAKKNNMIEALKHEISLLRDLKHPHIVQYLGSNSDDSHLNIFLEYVPGGSVASMLVNYGPLGEGLIKNFVRQILIGLAFLHSKDIIHRDIKGANILVDNKGSVKISDFGISKRVEASTFLNPNGAKKGGQRVSLQGSVFWMAPEVVKQTAYTRKADIWSLGCLVVEMFTGSHPHPNCTQLQAIFKIGGSEEASPAIPEDASEESRSFLQCTFEIDHEKRPTADELLTSPFVSFKA